MESPILTLILLTPDIPHAIGKAEIIEGVMPNGSLLP